MVMMVTELRTTRTDIALRLLARMIARAYLDDIREKDDNQQCLEKRNQNESVEGNDVNKRSI
jgi:hypothetical protein